MSCFLEFRNEGEGLTCVVEDDDRAAYAYICDAAGIKADVWLYNVVDTPSTPEWDLPGIRPPFLNSAPFSSDETAEPLTDNDRRQVTCEWTGSGGDTTCRLRVDTVLWAVLRVGTSPGWSRFAAVPGPVAGVLADAPLDQAESNRQ